MIVGGYDLHLYCDTGNTTPDAAKGAPIVEVHGYLDGGFGAFMDRNESRAKAKARRAGWTFKSGGFVYCPTCSRKKK